MKWAIYQYGSHDQRISYLNFKNLMVQSLKLFALPHDTPDFSCIKLKKFALSWHESSFWVMSYINHFKLIFINEAFYGTVSLYNKNTGKNFQAKKKVGNFSTSHQLEKHRANFLLSTRCTCFVSTNLYQLATSSKEVSQHT